MPNQNHRRARTPQDNLGILLIVAGVVILVLQYIPVDPSWLSRQWRDLPWPLHIIIPGLAVFVAGLLLPEGAGEGLSGFGLVVAAVGALLRYQDITGTWASWAYAWALVFPAAGGLAGIIHGTLHANWRHVRDSAGGFLAGIVMFLVLGFVFESWLGFEGFGLARLASLIPAWIPGAALLLVGLIVLLAGVAGRGGPLRSERDQQQAEHRDGFPAPTQAPGVPGEPTQMETIIPPDETGSDKRQPQ